MDGTKPGPQSSEGCNAKWILGVSGFGRLGALALIFRMGLLLEVFRFKLRR